MNDCVFIHGFGLSGFRSFGPEIQRIGPCSKINLIVGKNNCGKSNVLRFIQHFYPTIDKLMQAVHWPPDGDNASKFELGKQVELEVAVPITSQTIRNWKEKIDHVHGTGAFPKELEDEFEAFFADRALWIESVIDISAKPTVWKLGHFASRTMLEKCPSIVSRVDLLLKEVCGIQTPGNECKKVEMFVNWLLTTLLTVTDGVTIPAFRRIASNSSSKATIADGSNIIERLAILQDPVHHEQHLRSDFDMIQEFLREVVDNSSAELRIPHDRKTINVDMDGRLLPLESLGTGIHEVVILAAVATSFHEHVICLEEPEIHLHPLLQRKLLKYLDEKTDNQYFVSTHSAHLLDHPGASVFHVTLTDSGSVVSPATTPTGKFSICADLGYKASDLFQSNCVIWVEGPSDRIYLRAWIAMEAPELVEGIHYSIMFYGGRLLSHLTPNDPEVDDFISLRRLNRNMAVLMDSDRKNKRARLGKTKQRIRDEWENDAPGFAWVTKGREIENYVPSEGMKEALAAISQRSHVPDAINQFDKAIPSDKSGTPVADKVKVAHWIVENGKLSLEVLDLRKRIGDLCGFIRKANE